MDTIKMPDGKDINDLSTDEKKNFIIGMLNNSTYKMMFIQMLVEMNPEDQKLLLKYLNHHFTKESFKSIMEDFIQLKNDESRENLNIIPVVISGISVKKDAFIQMINQNKKDFDEETIELIKKLSFLPEWLKEIFGE